MNRETLKRWRSIWIYWTRGNHVAFHGTGLKFRWKGAWLERCNVEMFGRGNALEIEPGARLWGTSFKIAGENLLVRVGADCRFHGGHCVAEDHGSRLTIGSGCTLWSPTIVVQEGGSIAIGQDCLIATGTDLRNSDAHSIIDTATRKRINPARNIQISDHVWIGAHAQVLKGVTIAPRAIVAARAVVTKDVGPGELVAGIPAKVVRENVDWDARRL